MERLEIFYTMMGNLVYRICAKTNLIFDLTRRLLHAFVFRANSDDDITVKILYCGIFHGDIHLVKNKIWPTLYPTVPG